MRRHGRILSALAGVVIKELYRRKDFYVLFVVTAVITLLLGAQNFFHESGVVRYLKEICLLLIWVSSLFIAIATTARQIPAERENRTIYPLLAKPVSRGQFILGKFAGCWLASGVALAVFYFFFAVVSGSKEHAWPLVSYFQAFWLQWIMLGIVAAMVLLGSLAFTAPSSNGTICFVIAAGILLLGRHLRVAAMNLAEPGRTLLTIIYFAIPHLEFFDVRTLITHGWPPIPAWVVALATLYGLGYTALFLLAAWLVFRKEPLT